ncbi:MAG TPA: methylenetetrahydrofolate reductase [Acidimicrobiales bacterium]|nr:methylenetetrahydrofolate reductase [Acidimicrobiales bacterium]
MRVDSRLAQGLTRSFEFFPPKSDDESVVLDQTLRDLEPLRASFVSVTNRGGTASRQRTFDLVTHVQRERQTSAMAHLICVGYTRDAMRGLLARYAEAGVENVMALGGDPSDDPTLGASEFRYALELVELAREAGDFSIGVAAHPLGHPRSTDLVSDRRHLATKLRAADFAITQFFFEAQDYFSLIEQLGELGVTKPVIPGIMPVTTLSGISRMSLMGAAVPATLAERLHAAHRRGGSREVRSEGVRAASELCAELLTAGVPGLHFYTLNRSTATREIHSSLFGQ